MPQDPDQVLLCIRLLSRSRKAIHSMVFNVTDSASARLCRGPHEQNGVELPYQLAGKTQVEIPLAFNVDDSLIVHHLRGTLTYEKQVSASSSSSS